MLIPSEESTMPSEESTVQSDENSKDINNAIEQIKKTLSEVIEKIQYLNFSFEANSLEDKSNINQFLASFSKLQQLDSIDNDEDKKK